nr:cardiolipin synthase ClsB [uncultured Pseudomonas sp.]
MSYNWKDGNEVELLINGEEFFPSVFAAIRSARHEVLLETFIIYEDKVGSELQQALIDAAERGVNVDVMVDGYGTSDLTREFIATMASAGVRIRAFDPRPKLLGMRTNLFRRLHRKIVVVDAEVAFIGGINFSADHLSLSGPMSKQDYAVRVYGPIVADIHQASRRLLTYSPQATLARTRHTGLAGAINRFAGQARILLAIRDNEEHPKDIEEHYLHAIRSASFRLLLANAYFFPGYRLLRELRNAARRGVHVTLILQGQSDMPLVRLCSRLLYHYLLRDGVTIYEYCERPLHGKVALVDHEWSTVGSSNLDPLSLSLNLEANLIIRDASFNHRLYEHLQQLARESCKRITLKHAKRGYWWRVPLIFLSFHFLRHFPAIAGWLPAHSPRLKLLAPVDETPPKQALQFDREKTS